MWNVFCYKRVTFRCQYWPKSTVWWPYHTLASDWMHLNTWEVQDFTGIRLSGVQDFTGIRLSGHTSLSKDSNQECSAAWDSLDGWMQGSNEYWYMNPTWTPKNRWIFVHCKIWGSHSDVTEDSSLVGTPDREDDGLLIQQQSITTKKVWIFRWTYVFNCFWDMEHISAYQCQSHEITTAYSNTYV
jgi:hypothetical protein